MGHDGVAACLKAGVNDLGGTLMNESITRAAGSAHGQETSPEAMIAMIEAAGRSARQRSTTYGPVSAERQQAGFDAAELDTIVNTPAQKYERAERRTLIRPGIEA
jgi:FO synthase